MSSRAAALRVAVFRLWSSGLLLCTVREFPQAERFLRAGEWREKNYPLTRATLRNRTVELSARALCASRAMRVSTIHR